MKQETIKRIVAIIEKEEPNTDIFCVTKNDTGVISFLCGNPTHIAQATLAAMFDATNPKHANDIYNIVKTIAINILNNPSPMANDIASVMGDKIKEYERQ